MKAKLIFLITGLFAAITSISAQTYSGGSGTQSSPYLISTKADMVALATAVNGGTTYSGKYFLLTANISGITTCVGYQNLFRGAFDGGGYELDINNTSGVFGTLAGATIKNLGVKGTVTNTSGTSAGGICSYIGDNSTITNCYNLANITLSGSSSVYAGGICGYASGGNISNCYNLGDISTTTTSYYYYFCAGGICGSGENSYISNCYNLGDISATTTTSSSYPYPCAGGICGYYGTITSCFSAGTAIIAKRGSSNVSSYSGRIVGSGGTINNCYALSTMTINGTAITSSNVYSKNGGDTPMISFQSQAWIIENLSWDFTNVWQMSSMSSANKGLPVFRGTVTGPPSGTTNPTYSGGSGTQSSPYLISTKADMVALATAVNGGTTYSGKYFLLTANISGITTCVGYQNLFRGAFDGGGYELDINNTSGVFGTLAGATIKNLGVKGTVTNTSGTSAGGICSYIGDNSTITNCYNLANITLSGSSNVYVGGICGYGYGYGGNISNCYNLGDISATTTSSYSYAGGICGYSGTISNYYNLGNISATTSPLLRQRLPYDSSYAGGICGYSGTITSCFSAGTAIIANSSYTGRITSGGGTINNCYSLSTMIVNGTAITSSNVYGKDGGDTPMTSFQSQDWITENLSWDFTDVWQMSSTGSTNKGLPVFKNSTLTFTITPSAGSGGTISPSGAVTVNYGGSYTFTATPNSGKTVNQWLVNGLVVVTSSNSYTVSNVQQNTTVQVTFKDISAADLPTISPADGSAACGTISV